MKLNENIFYQEKLCVECGAGERRGGDPGVRPGRYILPRPPPPPSTVAKHCPLAILQSRSSLGTWKCTLGGGIKEQREGKN